LEPHIIPLAAADDDKRAARGGICAFLCVFSFLVYVLPEMYIKHGLAYEYLSENRHNAGA